MSLEILIAVIRLYLSWLPTWYLYINGNNDGMFMIPNQIIWYKLYRGPHRVGLRVRLCSTLTFGLFYMKLSRGPHRVGQRV